MNPLSLEPMPCHECLIYKGPPSRQLPALAVVMHGKLEENYRCMYLNAPTMVAGMRSALAAAGVDVDGEVSKGSLVLFSDRQHLNNGRFDIDRTISFLEAALQQALRDGYQGLWATGDMTWEMGPDADFTMLPEYERRLDAFLAAHPQMGALCQYHADSLPLETVRQGLSLHPAIFVSEKLSFGNPHFVPAASANEI